MLNKLNSLEALSKSRTGTHFSGKIQPSSESKKLGWEKRRLNKSIQGALVAELSKEIFDSKTGVVVTEAECFASGLLQEWKNTKDPRYAKLIMDFVTIDKDTADEHREPIQVIIQTSGSQIKTS